MADFVSTFMEMRNGGAAADCNRKFSELLAAIMETRKKGKITLTIEVSPARMDVMGDVKEVDLRHTCAIAKPELDQGRSVFFTTQDGRLSRQDPNQMEFEEMNESEQREVR